MKGEKFWYHIDEYRALLCIVLSSPSYVDEIEDVCDKCFAVPVEILEDYTGAPWSVGKIIIADVTHLRRYSLGENGGIRVNKIEQPKA